MAITNSRNFVFLIIILFVTYSANSQQNNFRTYTIEDGLPQSTIFDIKQDNRGYLWIGTNGGRITRFD